MALVPSEALVGGLSRVEETSNNRPPRMTSASHAHINTLSFRDGWVTASARMVDHSHHQAGYRYAKFGDLLSSISEQKNDGRERRGKNQGKSGKVSENTKSTQSPVLIATDTSTLHNMSTGVSHRGTHNSLFSGGFPLVRKETGVRNLSTDQGPLHLYAIFAEDLSAAELRGKHLQTTSSPSLNGTGIRPRNVAGLNASRATNLIEWRSTNGPFKNRQQILKVKGIGKKSFEQCAGFVRIQLSQDRKIWGRIQEAKLRTLYDLMQQPDIVLNKNGNRMRCVKHIPRMGPEWIEVTLPVFGATQFRTLDHQYLYWRVTIKPRVPGFINSVGSPREGHTRRFCTNRNRQAEEHIQITSTERDITAYLEKYLKEVKIGSVSFISLIDAGSSSCTIQATAAIKSGLPIQPCKKSLHGFGNTENVITSLGRIISDISMDSAVGGDVEMLVVPDNAQSTEVIIGRT
uniref:Uncharacterized protein n=1 Tax=Timema genevievae TaxID=629358 RepID=A0A7R9PPB7_TIMGE|nr:unnamed protein product [Timema genevievae]